MQSEYDPSLNGVNLTKWCIVLDMVRKHEMVVVVECGEIDG